MKCKKINVLMDADLCKKYNLTLQEALYLLFLKSGQKQYKEIQEDLIEKGLVTKIEEDYFITPKGTKTCDSLILDVSKDITQESLTNLAKSLKELYPKGKKNNQWYWSEGVSLIEKRLQLFFKKYGKFEDDEIIDATKKYLQDTDEGNRKLLKYFICKDKIVELEDEEGCVKRQIEYTSDLLTYIENKEEITKDWDNELT